MDLNIYLTFNGNAAAAMDFYAKAFETEIIALQRFGDMPGQDQAENRDKVLHARIDINGVGLMASDSMEGQPVRFGDNTAVSVNCNSVAEVNKAFEALSAGGKVTMPLQDTFWGAYFGMCTDPFGVHWMFNYDYPKAG